jgi:hypothetical protein
MKFTEFCTVWGELQNSGYLPASLSAHRPCLAVYCSVCRRKLRKFCGSQDLCLELQSSLAANSFRRQGAHSDFKSCPAVPHPVEREEAGGNNVIFRTCVQSSHSWLSEKPLWPADSVQSAIMSPGHGFGDLLQQWSSGIRTCSTPGNVGRWREHLTLHCPSSKLLKLLIRPTLDLSL